MSRQISGSLMVGRAATGAKVEYPRLGCLDLILNPPDHSGWGRRQVQRLAGVIDSVVGRGLPQGALPLRGARNSGPRARPSVGIRRGRPPASSRPVLSK